MSQAAEALHLPGATQTRQKELRLLGEVQRQRLHLLLLLQ